MDQDLRMARNINHHRADVLASRLLSPVKAVQMARHLDASGARHEDIHQVRELPMSA
jgi:hypothetical protein